MSDRYAYTLLHTTTLILLKGIVKGKQRLPCRLCCQRVARHYTRAEGGTSANIWFYKVVGRLPIWMEPTELDKVDTVTADDRGRITLGVEFAEQDVKVYVERVES